MEQTGQVPKWEYVLLKATDLAQLEHSINRHAELGYSLDQFQVVPISIQHAISHSYVAVMKKGL